MSSKTHYPAYQPIPTTTVVTMDNPALTRSTNSADDIDNAGAGAIPSTCSSQQLMPSSDSDSVDDTERQRQNSTTINCAPGARRCITRSQWFTVGVLCFVNLINYMDRFTIAGVLDAIQSDFHMPDDDAGLLQTVFVISYMVCAPIFGYMGDRYSRRWIMAIGVFLWSTTTLLGSFMKDSGWFMLFRALVGVGEASYSTIAPTIISDLFVHDMRSKMLAVFYFAIPVGSGFGYIVGSETAKLAGDWRWALRVTPALGIAAVALIMLIKDPERGESEGSHNLSHTTYTEDVKYLVKNRSFMLSTAGFTCVAFVAGALAWWGPKFIYLGLKMQPGNENLEQNDVSFKFGAITMIAGIIGVPLGSILSTKLVKNFPTADPLICAFGLILSVPLMTGAMIIVSQNTISTYILIFFGQLSLNMNWAIVADMLLYVVVPTRRSTAEAFQILISHALGDAGSPFLVGVLSEAIKKHLRTTVHRASEFISSGALESLSLTVAETINSTIANATTIPSTTTEVLTTTESIVSSTPMTLHGLSAHEDTDLTKFEALQYALFSTSFVEVIGGIFFLITAAFIISDKNKASQAIRGHQAVPNHAPVNIDEIS
ncbi:protein spinster isoform X2 [Stomoxys calcitrans]|uniref:Major facilitator superfamily (MFS) profile domain-containing protein n=1 Tax=Stomoxys calcitrans TaxID=35570 RepID=A0A1I8PM62_STOCA|nr:protein spinster isoform X2 [Stomoxys calcitrans]